ncbi:CRP-like cAMP-activated global transcriptional regulator [bacterium HR20]|nr:CRP-like cAMP-activated global transcriptional regulator [bacterium HR20]
MPGASPQTKLWYLKNFDIFGELDAESMEQLERMTTSEEVRKGELLYFPAQPSRAVFFLKRGHIKISRFDENGREMIVDILGPGEIFGEIFEEGAGTSAYDTAETLDDVLICAISPEDFRLLLSRHPEASFELVKQVGFRLRRIERRLIDYLNCDVVTRLVRLLVSLAEDFGKIRQGIVIISLPLSHSEIAMLIGASRQTVTSLLTQLRSEGILEYSRHQIILKQYEDLRKRAHLHISQ